MDLILTSFIAKRKLEDMWAKAVFDKVTQYGVDETEK